MSDGDQYDELYARRAARMDMPDVALLPRSKGPFVLTTWDSSGDVTAEALMRDREIVADSRPLLSEAGFRVHVFLVCERAS